MTVFQIASYEIRNSINAKVSRSILTFIVLLNFSLGAKSSERSIKVHFNFFRYGCWFRLAWFDLEAL
jgi:hypothetical protein